MSTCSRFVFIDTALIMFLSIFVNSSFYVLYCMLYNHLVQWDRKHNSETIQSNPIQSDIIQSDIIQSDIIQSDIIQSDIILPCR